MDHKQSETMQKDIKSFLSRRQKKILADKNTRVISYLLAFPVCYLMYIQAFFLYERIKFHGFKEDTIVQFINTLTFLFLAFILTINYSNPPKDREKLDEWLWKKGQRRTILIALIFFLQTLAQLFDGSIFGNQKYYVAGSYLAFVLFFGCVFLIVYNPKWFFSKTINIFGTASFLLFLGYMPFRIIILMGSEINNLTFLWSLPAILLLIFGFSFLPISVVQITAIQIIEPDRLFSYLRSEHQIIQDQYKALQIKSKLEKEISLGIKTELIKLYAEEFNKRNKKYQVIGLAVGLFIFILTSLGDAFIQDTLYESLVKPILCKIFSVSCN